jgi:hypothetical protein
VRRGADARVPPGRGAHRVEVARRAAEDQVATRVGLPCLDEGIVADDRLLEDKVAPAKVAQLARLGLDRDGAVGVVLDRRAALLHERACRARRVEGGDARTARTHLLGEGALRRELHLELARQVEPLERLVLADVARDHPWRATHKGEHVPAAAVGWDSQADA